MFYANLFNESEVLICIKNIVWIPIYTLSQQLIHVVEIIESFHNKHMLSYFSCRILCCIEGWYKSSRGSDLWETERIHSQPQASGEYPSHLVPLGSKRWPGCHRDNVTHCTRGTSMANSNLEWWRRANCSAKGACYSSRFCSYGSDCPPPPTAIWGEERRAGDLPRRRSSGFGCREAGYETGSFVDGVLFLEERAEWAWCLWNVWSFVHYAPSPWHY